MSKIYTYGSGIYLRGASLIEFAHGAGGRICDMAPDHLDMVAEAIVHAHPEYLPHCVLELLVSGRYRSSQHRKMQGVTLAVLRRQHHLEAQRDWQRRSQVRKNKSTELVIV